jgi:hypothetical protein
MRVGKSLSCTAVVLLALFALAPSPSAACTGWCDYNRGCGDQCRWEGAGVTQMGCYNSGCACIETQEICGYSVVAPEPIESDPLASLLNAPAAPECRTLSGPGGR